MKKLLAFLLAACLLIGLVACAKPSTNSTDSSTGNNSADNNNNNNNNNSNDGGENNENDGASNVVLGEGPYKGKTLQIWGFASNDSYNNFKNMGVGNYIWMMRAAIDEWAAINGVTIEYINDYNQGEILSDINSGENPDLLFQHNQYPPAANFGIIGAFTEEEYNKIAQYTDKGYLDLMTMGGKSYGYVLPWTGTYMFYYNKTMFENYDVKTPKEYFMEGNWTWTTFKQCMDEVSKDLDGDGKLDTIGLPEDSASWVYGYAEDENGRLYSTMDDQMTYDFLELLYEYKVQKKTIVGRNNIWSNVTYPMTAMQFSDCEPYNFEHLYKYIKNGDLIELYAQDADASYAYIQRAKEKGYDVLLMDGELDVHAMSQYEQKSFEAGDGGKLAVRFVRVDSDVIENIIQKEDKAKVELTANEEDALRYTFESQLPKTDKTRYDVSLEAVSADALPVFLTQNEFMRRMKEMSAHQQGMAFYGNMPDQYNLVVNTANEKVKTLLADITSACEAGVSPLLEQITAKKAEEATLQEAQKGKKEADLTQEEKDAVTNVTKELAALKMQLKEQYANYATSSEKVKQLIDIAMLAAGQLKGEALAKFVNRSVELL